MLCITYDSIKHRSFVFTQLNDQTVLFLIFDCTEVICCIQFKRQTVLLELTLSGDTTPGQSGPGSDGNIRVRYNAPKPKHHWNLTIWLFSFVTSTLVWGVLPLYRDAVDVFFSPRRLGWLKLAWKNRLEWK